MTKLQINGVTYEAIGYSFERRAHLSPAVGHTIGRREFTTTLTEEGRDFFESLSRLPSMQAMRPIAIGHRGNASTASLLTLVLRAEYGGRKGRSARRRVVDGVWGPTPVTIEPPHIETPEQLDALVGVGGGGSTGELARAILRDAAGSA